MKAIIFIQQLAPDICSKGLKLNRFERFSALRVLELTQVDLPEDDNLVNDFLKSCPLLEDLSLLGCLLGEVCISYPNLKKLRIINWDDVGCHGFKICCPKLVNMELGGRVLYGDSDSEVFHGNYHFKWAHLYFSFQVCCLFSILTSLHFRIKNLQ